MASGSNTRKRKHQTIVRWDDPEWDEALAKADAMGLSLATALRNSFLGIPGTPAQKHKPAPNKKLRTLFGHCGKIGSNVTQITRVLDAPGQAQNPRLAEAAAAYPLIRTAVLAALNNTDPQPTYNPFLPSLIEQAADIGKHMNHLARAINSGRPADDDHLATTLAAYLKLRDTILAALKTQSQERPANDHQGK